ncbi:molybdate ABC transporter substrate-binding protein [Caminibacter pacificus]
MKKLLFFLLLTPLFASQITIAVATNVSYAIKSLVKDFNKLYPDVNVRVVLGSSGKLTAQIKNHAPYDIFLSANMKYPWYLYKNGYAFTRPVVYARGALAFFAPKKTVNSIEDIKNLNKIAMPNPSLAPYGKAAQEFLHNKWWDLHDKIVFTETVTQALSYALAATDGAFVAKSALFSPKMKKYKEGVHWIEIPSKYYEPINQGIVLLSRAKSNKNAAAFYTYMLSKRAAEILEKYGYIVK